MSRLDSFIRRVQAQRDCLNAAAHLLGSLPGPVLEIGLGNGRTYDHLRERFADREIFVFDRRVAAHPDCIPDASHMILGDFRETLPLAAERLGALAALAHVDCGSGDEAASRSLAREITAPLLRLLRPGALLISDQPMPHPDLEALTLPDGVAPDRYFIYRLGQP
jgi:hypothetical protein